MNAMNEQHDADDAAAAVARADFEFVVDGATISVVLGGSARDATASLEKAKLAIARLASLQEAELARQKQTRVRQIPNVFDYWAYRRD